jgi:hypothetical protein
MKVDVFKKIIKECIREVLREEISQIKPASIQENKNISFTTQDVDMVAYRHNLANMMGLQPPPTQNNSPVKSTGNPYLDIIAETASAMTPQEMAQMRQSYE